MLCLEPGRVETGHHNKCEICEFSYILSIFLVARGQTSVALGGFTRAQAPESHPTAGSGCPVRTCGAGRPCPTLPPFCLLHRLAATSTPVLWAQFCHFLTHFDLPASRATFSVYQCPVRSRFLILRTCTWDP